MENTGNHQEIMVPPVEGVAGGGTAYGWTDSEVHDPSPLRGAIDPAKVPSSELVHVWCMPSTANVGQQEMPQRLEPISLLAARNERESIQVAIRPKVSWGGSGFAGTVQVQCTDLCSSSGDRLVVGQSLTLKRVVPVLGVPEALVPLDMPVSQLNLFPGETTAIWVSIDVPIAQPPGQYEGEIIISAIKAYTESTAQSLSKAEKHQLYRELRNCLDIVEPTEGKPMDEVVERVKSATSSLRSVLLSPSFSDFFSDNGPLDMMDEDAISNLSVRLKLTLTVWEFILPVTPSIPAVIGISDTVIEDRFGVEHGSNEWYEMLDQHFKWLLQYRISPYFCRWGDNMRVLTYTCPWQADHPKSDEYFSDPRLAAYAVPHSPVVTCGDTAKDYLQREVEILRTKPHWRKAYFYLWDEVRFFYSFTSRDYLYLVVEYLNGGDLYSLLRKVGCLEEDVARIYIAELVLALDYLHSLGIVHRDLKPDNILIAQDGHIKLTDFGLSKIGLMNSTDDLSGPNMKEVPPSVSNSQLNPDTLDKTQRSAVGTPDYLAPEILLGTEHGSAADWWSVGIILFELITGVPPFTAEHPEIIFDNILNKEIPWPSIPGEMSFEAQDLIDRLLVHDPSQRLGANGASEVKEHRFFKGVDWDNLALQKAAFVPQPDSIDDTSYFVSRYNSDGARDDEDYDDSTSVISEPFSNSSLEKMDECGDLTEFDASPLDLSLMNFSFKNLSQLASINHEMLVQSGKDSSRSASPCKGSHV